MLRSRRPAGCRSTGRSARTGLGRVAPGPRAAGPPGRIRATVPGAIRCRGAASRGRVARRRRSPPTPVHVGKRGPRRCKEGAATRTAPPGHPTDGGAGLGPLGCDPDSEIRARPGSATGPGPRDQGRPPPSDSAALRRPRDPVRGRAARVEACRSWLTLQLGAWPGRWAPVSTLRPASSARGPGPPPGLQDCDQTVSMPASRMAERSEGTPPPLSGAPAAETVGGGASLRRRPSVDGAGG